MPKASRPRVTGGVTPAVQTWPWSSDCPSGVAWVSVGSLRDRRFTTKPSGARRTIQRDKLRQRDNMQDTTVRPATGQDAYMQGFAADIAAARAAEHRRFARCIAAWR